MMAEEDRISGALEFGAIQGSKECLILLGRVKSIEELPGELSSLVEIIRDYERKHM